MTSPRFLPAGILFVIALSRLMAAPMDAPAVNADAILRDLDQIQEKHKRDVESIRNTAVSQIKQAAASGTAAADLYERAIEAMQFDGVRNKGGAFADWKSSKAALLRTKEMQVVLLLHLKYLVLSLERKGSDKPELFVQPSLAFVNELIANDEMFLKLGQGDGKKDNGDAAMQKEILRLKDDLLNKSLAESVFVKWLRLGPWLPKGEDWELTPGNFSGILGKNIRPVLRAARDQQLLGTWELEMKVLADRVTFGRLEHQADEFNNVTRPRLQFSRANDMIEIGQANRGITEIYTMVKTYPQHPDFGKWVQRLRELLKPAAPVPAAVPDTTP